MSLTLNDKKATGILIWWIEGADGSIEKDEEDAVEDILNTMDYSMKEYRQKTKMFISGLSEQQIEDAVNDSIQWGTEHFDEQRQQKTVDMLKIIARSNGKSEKEQENIDQIKENWRLT